MIEAVKLWTEPNNKSHWDFEIDSEWKMFARMASLAGEAVRGENGSLTRVLGGISPIDAKFLLNMKEQGVLDRVDAVAVHGFPLDWNHWQIHEWPDRLAEIQAKFNLRLVGYDHVLSIEHEDSIMSPAEGLKKAIAFLKDIVIAEPAGEAYWA